MNMDSELQYADSTMEIRGLELRVLDTDPGALGPTRTFVLVHGLGVSSLYFRELADDLAAHGRVIAIDLPGFGRTDKPERSLRIGQLAGVLAEALQRLDPDGVVLVGHSMGCQVVVEALADDPGIADAAVLIGPVVNAAERRLPSLLWRFLQAVLRETPASVAPSILGWLRTGPRMLIETVPTMLAYPLEDRIADVAVPLLLVAGRKDATAPRAWLDRLACAAGGEAFVEVVEDASHQVMVTHPGRVTAAIVGPAPGDRR